MIRTESRQRVRFLGCPQRTTRVFKNILYLVIGCFAVIGFVGVVENGLSSFLRHSPDTAGWMPDSWGRDSLLSQQLARWPTDATADQQPIHCHSHNDYWRKVPLYSAIYVGYSSVEADVWLVDGELYVSHRRLALTSSRTLRNLYLNPLLTFLEKQNTQSSFYSNDDYPLDSNEKFPLNGVFDADPRRSFVSLIDFKSYGPALWWELNSQLSLFRGKSYLTYYNSTDIVEGPITIVASGEAHFEWLTANETYRDIFFDAPLEELVDNSYKWPNPNRAQDSTRETRLRARKVNSVDLRGASSPTSTSIPWPGNIGDDDKEGRDVQNLEGNTSIYNSTISYYASVSFTAAVGHVWRSRLSQKQLQLIRSQIRGFHQQGLKVRYWGVPRWPLGLRNHIWHILMREGADVLSVDNLYPATQTDWRIKRSWDWPS